MNVSHKGKVKVAQVDILSSFGIGVLETGAQALLNESAPGGDLPEDSATAAKKQRTASGAAPTPDVSPNGTPPTPPSSSHEDDAPASQNSESPARQSNEGNQNQNSSQSNKTAKRKLRATMNRKSTCGVTRSVPAYLKRRVDELGDRLDLSEEVEVCCAPWPQLPLHCYP